MSEESDHCPSWLTPAEVAERWRCSSDTIIRYCKSGKLLAMKRPGGSYLIHRDTIDEREAQQAANEFRRTMRNSRQNQRYTPSGVDHFANGKQH